MRTSRGLKETRRIAQDWMNYWKHAGQAKDKRRTIGGLKENCTRSGEQLED